MSREMSLAMAAALAAENGEICLLLQMNFSGGNVFLTSASQDIFWNGTTWIALGGLLSFSNLSETFDLSSTGLEVKLSGVDQTIVGLILNQNYIGRGMGLWSAHLGTDGTVTADPLPLFAGYMNGGFSIQEDRPDKGGGSVTITARFADRLAFLNERHGIQVNTGSHQIYSPGDTLFQAAGQLNRLNNGGVTWQQSASKGVNIIQPRSP